MVGTSPMFAAPASAPRISLTFVNILYICARCGQDLFGKLRILLRERWNRTVGESEDIVGDQHLSVALRTGANADGGNFQTRRNSRRQFRRYRFQHDGENAGFLENF